MGKELTIDYVNIRQVVFGPRSELKGGVLTVNKDELIDLTKSPVFGSFDIKIASPGEDCRIIGIMDSMQPRCKPEAPDTSYPGILGKMAPAGEGKTVALRGVLVSEIYYPKLNIKWYLDMCEPCSKYSFYSRHHHVILDATPGEGISDITYAEALKRASLTANVYLAKLGIGQRIDKSEVFSHRALEGKEAEGLPRVAYINVQMASHDTWNFLYYGQSALGYLPTVIQPTEILDGAVIYRYWDSTYQLQDEPYVRELLSRHGKDINFVGVVFANNVMKIDDKNAMTMMAASLCKHTLRADCVMVNKSGMGHGQLDATMAFNWSQTFGMPGAVNLAGVSNDVPGDMLVVADPKVDAVINSGRDFVLTHPKVKRLIGEGTNVPCLLGHDPWGPFTRTTNCGLVAVYGQLGTYFQTEDDDIDWTVAV
ncbi:beta-aspartyl-peptidase [Synergistales bacterium]|nr:beta-aspartyl-peptidase [Synergistales bacterium]